MKLDMTTKMLILTGVLSVTVLFVKDFKVFNAYSEVKAYLDAVDGLQKNNETLESLINEESKMKKAVGDLRTSATVDMEDIVSIYNGVCSIPDVGKESITSKLIRITDNVPKEIADFDETDTENVNKADGIKMTIICKNVGQVVKGLNDMQVPYLSLNVIYPENKIIVIYNTKGGV